MMTKLQPVVGVEGAGGGMWENIGQIYVLFNLLFFSKRMRHLLKQRGKVEAKSRN